MPDFWVLLYVLFGLGYALRYDKVNDIEFTLIWIFWPVLLGWDISGRQYE